MYDSSNFTNPSPYHQSIIADNQPVVTLIEGKRPPGILALLDEETVMPRATDATFATKCGRHIQSPSFVGMGTTHFQVTHYAGDVVYTINGMLEKNKDQLNKNLLEMLGNCNSDYIRSLYPPVEKTNKRPPTASFQFKKQMGELMNNLKQCEAHYVRTIKPNDLKKGGVFTDPMVKNQVTYLGLKENVLVRRAGYAVRQDYNEFFERYRLLSEETWPFGSGDAVHDCLTILRSVGVSEGFEKGKTKIFIRKPETLFTLEDVRDSKLNMVANKIQKAYRAWIAIKYFLELRRKADEIFGGKKRRSGSIHLNFHGDYVAIKESLQASIAMREDPKSEENFPLSDIMFADFVDKVNRKGIVQERILAISSKAFYFLTPPLDKTAVKTKNNLNCLLGLSMSTMADSYLVLHFSDHDFVIASRRKAEIVMILKERYAALMEAELPLAFSDSFEYKTFGGGLFRKRDLVLNQISFVEDRSLPKKETVMRYESGSLKISVSAELCSSALIQLNDNYSSGGGGGGRRSRSRDREVDRREGRCFHCKRKGHLARDCREEGRGDSRDRGRGGGGGRGSSFKGRIRVSISPDPSWFGNDSCNTSEMDKDRKDRVMKALDNMNRKPRGGGGYRGGKRRSPSPYSDYSRSYSDDSYRKKGRKSRSASVGRKGKRDSRSAGSKS